MNISLIQILAAILMVGAAIVLVFAFRRYQAANSERRMRAMLTSVGLDPEIASIGGIDSIMTEVRKRCRTCASEDVCERWLNRELPGNNDFCPNAKAFEAFRKTARPWPS
jgi:preprotein translocase subunit YajC